jgi:hypothetical protein
MLMGDYWHDAQLASHFSGHDANALGQEYLINNAGLVTPAVGTSSHPGSNTSSFLGSTISSAPPPTLVGSSNGLQIDLVWDSSVAHAPKGFMQAIIDAAAYYTTLFSNHEVITMDVGYGEIAGSPLSPSAVGESESYGYLTNYGTVTAALSHDGFVFSASNEPTNSQFFLTSAEAKALGLVNPTSGLDGYIGFSTLSGTGYSWNLAASVAGSNTGTAANQLDLQSVAFHEISEVMGRVGMDGTIINGKATDTPLDLFKFQSSGVLDLAPNGGYFSNNDGATHLGTFNNASLNGGDIADWASSTSPTQSHTVGLPSGTNVMDAYDAFIFAGYNGDLSQSDILELAALGYKLTPTGVAAA